MGGSHHWVVGAYPHYWEMRWIRDPYLHVSDKVWTESYEWLNCQVIDARQQLLSDTKLQICSLLRFFKTENANIQRQPNSYDCGVFATATQLALGKDPVSTICMYTCRRYMMGQKETVCTVCLDFLK